MNFTKQITLTAGVGETKNGEPISLNQQRNALHGVMRLLSETFGGATLRAAKGAYVMDSDGRLVTEDAAEVVVSVGKMGTKERAAIEKATRYLLDKLEQETILVTTQDVDAKLVG